MSTYRNKPEEWRPVFGFEGLYEVSSHGNVRSLYHRCGWKWTARLKILRKSKSERKKLNGQPRYVVTLYDRDGQRFHFAVAVLVAAAFIGPKPFGMQVDHINDNALDDCADNLQHLNCQQNVQKAWRYRKGKRGEEAGAAILTLRQVRAIRTLISTRDLSQYEIADMFGVSRPTIAAIKSGRTWKHLK